MLLASIVDSQVVEGILQGPSDSHRHAFFWRKYSQEAQKGVSLSQGFSDYSSVVRFGGRCDSP